VSDFDRLREDITPDWAEEYKTKQKGISFLKTIFLTLLFILVMMRFLAVKTGAIHSTYHIRLDYGRIKKNRPLMLVLHQTRFFSAFCDGVASARRSKTLASRSKVPYVGSEDVFADLIDFIHNRFFIISNCGAYRIEMRERKKKTESPNESLHQRDQENCWRYEK
jgi:hypothetical protein